MDSAEVRLTVRAVLARRLRWLWRLLAVPGVRRVVRGLGMVALIAHFLFVALILLLRYAVLPQVGEYQAEIEQAASRAVGMPVRIERLQASWAGLNPRLVLDGVRLVDAEGLPALAFTRVEGVLSWTSLWRLRPILALLALEGPVLHVRRDANGHISVAGVKTEGEADPRLAELFFEQRRIRIRNATIVWEDAARRAPPLILEDLQFALDNHGSRHRFGLSAVPPAELAARIDVRGDVRGDPVRSWEHLAGKVYAELDYADLAGWRAWVDYPFLMRQGRGALRLWGDWKNGEGSTTVDVALEDVRVRLGRDVPQLELADMRGRIEGAYRSGGWRVAGRKVELSGVDGLRIPPTDFSAEWREKGEALSGRAAANYLDLEVLQQLAAYLPLDAHSRDLLTRHKPRGRIADLKTNWEVNAGQLEHYGLQAQFQNLGVQAAGYFPGAEGLSGDIEANDRGGRVTLDTRTASLDLPSVFPEPHIPLDSLHARAHWKIAGKKIDARLERIDFAGPDAAGSAQGSYRFDGEGPGVIDLTANLARASGTAVWRYMPHVVSSDAREWLKRSIVAGTASDARLTLKGDLRHFPFAEKKQGEFLITARAKDVKIDYAPGWPALEGVDANLSFGAGMLVEAKKGSILGTHIVSATAEIPNFDVAEEMLLVNGTVEGPTAEFLRFVDKSPVGDNINRVTDDMRAVGNGRLALRLDMPLRHVVDTRIRGEYLFQNNQIVAVPGLPPVTQANGRITFTENSVVAPEITGQIFGAPMRLSIKNEKDRVLVNMSGSVVARELKKLIDSPVLDYVSGQAGWKGEVRVRKKTAEFVIESSLAGLASSLPEPFNKSAAATLPLRIEKTALTQVSKDGRERDQLRIHLRGVGEGWLHRRQEGDAMLIERGAAAVGAPLPAMPARGVAVALNVPRLDGDFWRQLANRPGNGKPAPAGSSLPVQLMLKTPLLRIFERDFNAVEVLASPRDGGWQMGIRAQEAEGELYWQGDGKGSLKANMKRFALPAEKTAAPGAGAPTELLDSLPALDLQIADFSVGGKRLGRLETRAHNDKGLWVLDHLALQNPDGSLKGKGQWHPHAGQRTQLDFELLANDAGKLLERLGYANAVRRGNATLRGNLAWNGGLTAIHYPSLTGELRLHAEKGQFAKVEPGLGKLLGLLSLQSLPRRLTLDFRDIFSEGLAFDAINARLAVQNGVLRTTEDLRIDAPAARILMKGEADLRQETQNLIVTVQPEMGAVAAAGAVALAHPVVGAVTLLANKLLQNPLNKIFAFQYRVTGSWADPKVEKTGQSGPAAFDPALPGGATKPAAEGG